MPHKTQYLWVLHEVEITSNLGSYLPFLQVGATLLEFSCYYYKPRPLVNMIGECCALYNNSVCVNKLAVYQPHIFNRSASCLD